MKKIKRVLKKIIDFLLLGICSKKIIKLYKSKNDDNLLKLDFKYLKYLLAYDKKMFKKIKAYIEERNIELLKSSEKIKVGFVLYTSSMWSCDDLFIKLKNDSKYDPYIIVCQMNNSKEAGEKNYESTIKFFQSKNFPLIKGKNLEKDNINDFNIIFYLTPFGILPKHLNIINLPLSILTIYIPYSFMIAERNNKFELPIYYLTWKYFVDTLIYKELMKEKCPTGDDNVLYCGFSRMDEFYNGKSGNEKIWKIPRDGNKRVFKIIYAPHHSVNDSVAGFSTFDQNGIYMYELAKKYSKETSWIVKPHPLLRSRIIQNGYFKSVDEYDDYLKKWDELPNAKVVTDGTYFDIFKTSDSMILDSVSFLAEYQYVHKPLLLLTRESQHFNDFGERLKDILYMVDGNNHRGIEEYLVDVVINNHDFMKEKREEFFDSYLNYFKQNNSQLSSDYIYNFLEKTFRK